MKERMWRDGRANKKSGDLGHMIRKLKEEY